MPRYFLRTLGSLGLSESRADGELAAVLGAGKPTALLAYLALAPNRSALRDECIDLLWSNMESERARLSLRQALWHLRSTLGLEGLESEGRRLILRADLAVDLLDFIAAAESERPEAISLFTGRFMEAVSFPGGVAFEQWADLQRTRAEALLLHAAEAVIQHALHEGRPGDALAAARRARDLLPRHQSAWRLLIEGCLAIGDRSMALVEAEVLNRWLEDEEEDPDVLLGATLRRLQRARDDASASRNEHEAEFVGREKEFAGLLRAFHASAGGKPRHVHVSGGAGIGKTRLLGEFGDRIRALRARVAMVQAVPSDRGLPFSLLSRVAQSLGALPGAASVAPESAAVLVRLAPSLSASFSAPTHVHALDDALVRTEAVRELIEAVAAERHLVLLVDDLHWGDRESLDALARLADRLPASVLFVTTARPPVVLHATSTAETLELAPLSAEQVQALLAGLGFEAAADEARPIAVALSEASGGSPLLVVQLVRQGVEEGWLVHAGDRLVASPDVDVARAIEHADPIGRRLRDVTGDARRVLQLVALAGFPVEDAILADALGHEVDDVLRSLASRGVLTLGHDGWRCVHDAIAERVLALAPEGELQPATVSLGHALARRADSARDARIAARFLAAGGEREAIRSLVVGELVRNRALRRYVPARDVAGEVAGEALSEGELRSLLRSLPLRDRISRRLRIGSAIGAAAAVIVLTASAMTAPRLGLEIAQRPEGSVQSMADRLQYQLIPPLVVEQRDRDGALRGDTRDTVDVILHNDPRFPSDTTSLPLVGGRATFSALRAHSIDSRNAWVRKRGALDSLPVVVFWNDDVGVPLKLVAWTIGAGQVTPGHNTIRVPPRGSFGGTIRMWYASRFVDATVILAATPTWGDPAKVGFRLATLSGPTEGREREDPLAIVAPEAPGEYFLILIPGAELDASNVLSGTNWTYGNPVWGDGNDVARWPRERLMRALRGQRVWVRGANLHPERAGTYRDAMLQPIVIRIIVDPAVSRVTIE